MSVSRLLKLLAALGLILGLFLAFLPVILSSGPVKKWLLAQVYQKSGVKLYAGHLEISWSGPQKVEGLQIEDEQKGVYANIDKVILDTPLLTLFFSSKPLLKGDVTNLSAHFTKLDFNLKNINGIYQFSEKNKLEALFKGETQKGKETGALLVDIEYDPFNEATLSRLDVKIVKLPTALLDTLFSLAAGHKDWRVSSFLGKDLNITISPESESTAQFKIDIESDLVSASFLGKLQDGTFSLKPASKIRYILSEEALEMAEKFASGRDEDNQDEFYLVRPVELTLDLKPLVIPLKELFEGELPHVDAELNFSPITVQKASANDFLTLNNLNFSLSSKFQNIPEINVSGALSTHRPKLDNSSFNGTVIVDKTKSARLNLVFENNNRLTAEYFFAAKRLNGNLLIEKGTLFDDRGATLADLQNFHVPFTYDTHQKSLKIDVSGNARFFHQNEFGTMKATLQLGAHFENGIFSVDIRDKNLNINTSGSVLNGILYLDKEFQAALVVNESVSKSLLSRLVPFLKEAVSSDQPIVLKLDPAGFSLPLSNPKSVTVSSGICNLGKMRFKNEGKLAEWLSLLKVGPQEVINIWATPAYFSIDQGLIALKRVDLLVLGAYPLALWGQADLLENKINMTVGLSGAALSKAVSLSSALPSDYMMQFPINGSFSNISLDTKRASAKIAGLMAELHGTPTGIVLGTVLQIAGGLGEDKPPPPTTDPLPWSLPKKENPTPTPLKPIKQIEKGASSLLKSLFN